MASNQKGWFSSIFGSGNTLLPTTAPSTPAPRRNANRNANARVVPVAPHPATMLTLPASRAGSPVPNVPNGPLPNGRGSPAPPPAPAAPAITNASGGKAPIVKNNTSANHIAVNVGGPSMVGGKRRTKRKNKKSRKSKSKSKSSKSRK
jgi:hypothetical protein